MDMLATLLLRWKTVLLCLLAGALVFAAATFSSFPRTTTVRFVTEADVVARQADSALNVEPVGAWTSYVARVFLQQWQVALWTNYNNAGTLLADQNKKSMP